MKRRLLAMLLSAMLVVSMIPVSAFAIDGEPEPQGVTWYVSERGVDASDRGKTEDTPLQTLSTAVTYANNNDTIVLLTNLTSTKYAYITGKDITINGNGHTVTRGADFTREVDSNRGGYNPAMIEVANHAKLTLRNITLNDGFLNEADTESGEDIFMEENTGNTPKDNHDKVQDAIIAAYGDGEGTIILGEGTTLKNFGGMSAVRVGGDGVFNNPNWRGSTLIMEAGSQIIDTGAERLGGYGAIWNQGGKVEIRSGASVHDIDGRAIMAEDGSTTTVNGSIYNITSNEKMKFYNGASGNAFAGMVAYCAQNSVVTLGKTGAIYKISSHDQNQNDVAFLLVGGTFEMLQGSSLTDVDTIGIVDANGGAIKIDGTIRDIVSKNVLFRLRGGGDVVFALGENGVITDCEASVAIVYKNGGRPKITIRGEISNTSNISAVLYISPNNNVSGGVCTVTETGRIVNNGGIAVYAGDPSAISIKGEISGNDGYAIRYRNYADSVAEIHAGSRIEENNNGAAQVTYDRTTNNSKIENQHIKIAAGTLVGNKALEMPFGTITLDEDYSDIWLGQAGEAAKNEILSQVNAVVEQRAWKAATSSALWFKPTEDQFHFTMPRPNTQVGVYLYAAYLPLDADGQPQSGAQIQMQPLNLTGDLEFDLKNLTANQSYALLLIASDKQYVSIKPANIEVYMGGQGGYEGTVDENGNIVGSNSIPVPGFVVELPYLIQSSNPLELTFKGNEGREWELATYPGSEKAADKLYQIHPTGTGTGGAEQDPVRMQFTDAQDKVHLSDYFDVGSAVNQSLKMEIYSGGAGTVTAALGDGSAKKTFAVEMVSGTLTVRGTTANVQTPLVQTPEELETKINQPAVTAPAGTMYTINGGDIKVQNPDAVALLFDDIINSDANNREDALEDRATAYFEELNEKPDDGNQFTYEFKYLDLVDTSNGNAWVAAKNSAGDGQDVTIYWPLPAGTDSSTEFKVLHFKDLHRDLQTGQIEGAIENCDVAMISAEVEGDHVKFDAGANGFSPFALVWETPIPTTGGGGGATTTYTITASAGTGGTIDPSGKVSVTAGSSKTFTIAAADGYEIADVLVDGKSVGAVSTYTFEKVSANHTISASFEKGLVVADPDDTGVSAWLNTKDHAQYLNGYPEGTFEPDNNMTRAEAAQMFYNLLLDQDVESAVAFSDVPADAWYAKAVNTLASLGMINGVGDNKYEPDRSITRAEFTAIAMRFSELPTGGENSFSDVTQNDWFYDVVVGSIQYGWITGYPDGTFRPNATITRAEVTTITNRMLGRSADEAYVDGHAADLRQFSDLSKTHWAYYDIMEATNTHDYTKADGAETWTALYQ